MAGIGCFKGRNSSSNSATMASESPDVMANQEPAEAQEECSGKKKSKFQTFKKLFARKKRKEAAGAEAGMKSSQSSDNVSKTSEENTLTRSEKETGSGSKISLGNKALSHDSIFVSDSSEANEALGASQDSIHGKVKSLQLQLKQAIRLGSPPSLMCVKKMEDAGTTSEDDGLPCSPPEYTTPQAAMKQTHSSSSVSLEAVGGDDGQLPCASSSRGVSPLVAPGDFSQPASPMACLDNSAAKHKLGLRHKACNRRKPARKLEPRTEGQDMMDGTLDTSVSEPKEEPEQVVSLEELKSGFTREMEEENNKDEDDTEDEEEEEEPSQHSRKSLLSYSEESVEEEDSQSEDEQDISHNLDTSCPPEEDTPDPLHLSSPSSGTSSLDTPRASPEPPAGPREYLLDPLSTAYESLEDEVESRLLQKEEEEETSEKEEEEEEEESLLQEVLSSLKTPLVSCPISVKTEEVFLELETRKEEEEAVEVKDQEEEEKKEERSEVEELFSYQCHNTFTKEEEEKEDEEEDENGGGFTPSCQEELVSTEQERKSDNEEPEEEEEEEDGQLVNDQEEDEAAEDDETEEHKPEEKSFTDTGESEIQAQDVRDDKESEMEQEEEEEEEEDEEEEGVTLELQKEQEFDEEQWESRETHDEEGEEEEVDVQQVSLRVEMEEELEAEGEEEGDEEEGEEESVCDAAEEETGVLVSLGGAERGEGDNAASETKQGDDDEEEEDEILSKPSDESHDEVKKDTEVSEVAEENVEVTAEQEWEQETQEVDEDESEEEEEEEVTKDSDHELKQEEEEKTEVLEEVVSPARLPSLTLADSPRRPSSPEVGAVSPPLSPTKSGTTTVHINLVSPSAEKPPPVFRQVAETVDAAEKQETAATDEDQPVASVDDTVQQTPSRSEQSKARFTIAPAWQRSHSLTPPSSPPPCLTPVSPTLAEYKGEELETTTAAAEKESVVKAEPVSSPEVDVVWSPGRASNSGNSAAPFSSSSSSKPQNSAADTEESCVRSEGNPDSPFGIRLRKTSASHLFSSEEENTEMTSPSESPPQTTVPRVEPPPTVGVKPATNPSVSHRPVVPKKPEMHGDGGGKAKLFSDPAAARGGSVGSDSPSWISMAKQKQKIYQEKSLDMTVKKEEQEKKPSLPPQASRGQGSKTPESPGKVTLPAVKEAKRDLPPPTPVPAQPSKAHLLPCAVPPKPYVPPSTTKPADQRSRPSPTPVPVPQKPNSCTSPSSPPKPVTTSPSKPLPPQSAAVTPAAFSLVTAPEKSGPRAAVSPQRGLTGPPLPQDEPPWMALAKKKAKAWSEMPQIVQ